MAERLNGIEEVVSSNLIGSTNAQIVKWVMIEMAGGWRIGELCYAFSMILDEVRIPAELDRSIQHNRNGCFAMLSMTKVGGSGV